MRTFIILRLQNLGRLVPCRTGAGKVAGKTLANGLGKNGNP
jgi:hypothetical protein